MAGTISATKSIGKGRGIVKIKVGIVSDASGVATATVVGEAVGRLVAVGYKPTTDRDWPGVTEIAYDTGGDITITDADTGATLVSFTNIGTSAFWKRPTAVITTNAGAAVTAAATAVDVNRDIYVAGKIKVAGAQGGNLGACAIVLIIDESGF